MQVIQRFESLVDTGSEVAINTIVYGEIELMIEKSEQKEENRALFNEFIKGIRIYPIDEETAKIYGKFHSEIFKKFAPKDRAKRRKFDIKEAGVKVHDLWIACTAIQHDLVIVSEDSDFKVMNQVRNLSMECWKTYSTQ
jgi:tRNA(fMet)-specific endonuclease VapC